MFSLFLNTYLGYFCVLLINQNELFTQKQCWGVSTV